MRFATSRWIVTASLVTLALVAGCSSPDPFEEGAAPTFVADAPEPGTTTTPIPTAQQADDDIDPGTTTTPIPTAQQADDDVVPGTTTTSIPATASTPRGRTTTTTRTTEVGTRVSGPDLVDDCRATVPDGPCTLPPPDPCRDPVPDVPCVPATGPPPPPRSEISIGEYQVGVNIPPGRHLNVYFDPARTLDDMTTRCYNMEGTLSRRGDDGSRWAGWLFCMDVGY